MRFGKTLRNSQYAPWKDQYVDYSKLKELLREEADDDRAWNEEDENKFCDEILNAQLDKVAGFQEKTFTELEQRATTCGEKLRDLAPEDGKAKGDITNGRFKEIEGELDAITNEVKELKNYGQINYTAFLKIVKKHDRKRGTNYKIRPILLNALSKRQFNSEQAYSPLLHKLSMMYYIVRQQLDENSEQAGTSSPDAQPGIQNMEKYTAEKFWVHPDNLLEVKTFILRRLPSLVYSDSTSKEADATGDPTLNSLYFDNADFSLYSQKVDRKADASSVRIRWFGQLSSNPDLVIEKKTVHENGSSEEKRIAIKEKYIQPFIKGEYHMEKSIQKMERQGQPPAKIQEFKSNVEEIQKFILDNGLQPVVRANYTRTAYQKPLDDRIRISIDTQLALIREDALDTDRPCREPENWHRLDIDNSSMVYPFTNINRGEVSKFPFSLLEIKVREGISDKYPQWVEELSASHLVHPAPGFSKFVQGVATLFEDQVNNYPSWHMEVETDIRQDPQVAFEEEEKRKAKKAEDEAVVGSFLGTSKFGSSHRATAATMSPAGKSYMGERLEEERAGRRSDFSRNKSSAQTATTDDTAQQASGNYGTLSAPFSMTSFSRYAISRRQHNVVLPPGVTKPTELIKDSGPLKVEPKVWLANERTFIKWQHIAVLLGAFALTLFNIPGESSITMGMSATYIGIAVFTAGWGYYMHFTRRRMIIERSGKDFDNVFGPMVVALALMVSLIVNFVLRYQEASARFNTPDKHNVTLSTGWETQDVKMDLI